MRKKLKVLDLFSGIGGFSLGLERTGGFETVAFCEIDPFCRKVLNKHWPKVPVYEDVKTLTAEQLRADGIAVDAICGGFPCQDVSLAGRRAGLAGGRSGLWTEYARLIGELRPRVIFVENTPGLLSLGMGCVLGDLASLRYDAEWYCIPACYIGADHIRDRVWIVAYIADWDAIPKRGASKPSSQMVEDVADAMLSGLPRWGDASANSKNAGEFKSRPRLAFGPAPAFPGEYRSHKPVLGRGVHGIPNRVDRIAALGNAVVPQIPEVLGNAYLASFDLEAA